MLVTCTSACPRNGSDVSVLAEAACPPMLSTARASAQRLRVTKRIIEKLLLVYVSKKRHLGAQTMRRASLRSVRKLLAGVASPAAFASRTQAFRRERYF